MRLFGEAGPIADNFESENSEKSDMYFSDES